MVAHDIFWGEGRELSYDPMDQSLFHFLTNIAGVLQSR